MFASRSLIVITLCGVFVKAVPHTLAEGIVAELVILLLARHCALGSRVCMSVVVVTIVSSID